MEILNAQPHGRPNVVEVDGHRFHNLAALMREYKSVLSISDRQLFKRVQDMRTRHQLSKEDTLSLNAEQCAALFGRKGDSDHFQAFTSSLSAYVITHNLILVRGGDSNILTSHEPITPEEAYSKYEFNKTVLYFICKNCEAQGRAPTLFGKSRDLWRRQGCPVCSFDRLRKKQRLDPGVLRKRVEAHIARVQWIDEDDAYRNNRSILRLQCHANGHQFSISASTFLQGKFVACPDCSQAKIGESLSVAIMNFLLNTGRNAREVRELTPPHLAGTGLRHDGYFEIPDIGMKIAVEHNGPQHTDKNHWFHLLSPKGKDVSFKETIERDRIKDEACHTSSVVLVKLPDLVASCGRLKDGEGFVAAARIVIAELESSSNRRVLMLPGYAARVDKLSDEKFVQDLLPTAFFDEPSKRLQDQFYTEGKKIRVRNYDPISGFFELECMIDGEKWSAHRNNVLRSQSCTIPGTGCPICAVIARSSKRRLSLDVIMQRSLKLGFRPSFTEADYQNNSTVLDWQCLANPTHVVKMSFASLHRGCPKCRKETRDMLRHDSEYAKIKGIVEGHGNKLLSSQSEYMNQSSRLRVYCVTCGSEYRPMADKIKSGQRHGCDKGYRAAQTLRARRGET